jgi:hypothetical protein
MRFRNLLRSQAQILEAMMEAEEKEMPPLAPESHPPREPAPAAADTRWARNPRRSDMG